MATTVEDLAVQALARCAEFGGNYPTTRSVMYRRLGARQQALFAAAARANPEYFGATAIGTLDANKAVSLSTMGDPTVPNPVPYPELIVKVAVAASSGAGAPAVGTEVAVVSLMDALGAALPPRVTLRGESLQQVGTDLAQVTALALYYSRRPFPIGATDKAVIVELPEPFHELLVLDLARWMLRKASSLTKEVREVALAALEAEEKEELVNFLATVQAFTSAVERGRFGRTQGSTRQ